ncbi:hypothetical protein ACSQ67_025260 [Phaseolus vulgaris]
MVESADLECEASSGAGESVRIDRDVVGDAEGDAVASVYGGSGCVELKGPEVVADLEKLLRLLTLCMLFSKKLFPQFLDSVGFSQDHVLLHSPKVEVLTCPEGITALASEVVKDPLPVPDSRTTQPGTTSKMTGQHLRSLDESFKQSKDTITMVGCSQQQASSS